MGSSRNGRDSNAQRLGIKRFGGEKVTAGSILIRQRGTRYHAGAGVGLAKDDSLFALIPGVVKFEPCPRAHSTGKKISVYAVETATTETETAAA